MKPLTMLATPDGKWVFPNSAEFFAALGDSDPDYDAIAFAVKNLGFVKFQVLEQSITEIDLHPHTVELPALLAVQQQILTSPTRLFLIKYFDSDWRSEISSTVEHTIERLSELCAPVCTPPTNDKFVVVEVKDFSDLFDDEYSQLRPLGQKWRASFGLAIQCFRVAQRCAQHGNQHGGLSRGRLCRSAWSDVDIGGGGWPTKFRGNSIHGAGRRRW